MTVAAPPVPSTTLHENGPVHAHGPVNPMTLPRFHPIAMNPNQHMPPDPAMQHHFRPYPPPPPQQHPHLPHSAQEPGLHPSHIEHIEARLRQLENEEAARMATRSQLLAIRKREDEDFRRMTENAEAEEEVFTFDKLDCKSKKTDRRRTSGDNGNDSRENPWVLG